MGFVGVLHPSMVTKDVLKRHFLYFDEFHIPGLKLFKWHLSESENEEDHYNLQNLEYLESVKVIRSIDMPVDEIDKLILDANVLQSEQIEEFDSYAMLKPVSPFTAIGNVDRENINLSKVLFRNLNPSKFSGNVSPLSHPLVSNAFESIESDILSRAYSIGLNSKGVPTTPIIKNINYVNSNPGGVETVIAIAVDKFPDLSGAVPFAEIISFKEENYFLKLELRNWINEIVKVKLTAKEIEEKLEYLLEKYKCEIKQHKFDIGFDRFETIVKVPFEVAENLIRLKFSSAIGAIFNIKHRQVRLLKQEAKLEGKEVAYLHHAKTAF